MVGYHEVVGTLKPFLLYYNFVTVGQISDMIRRNSVPLWRVKPGPPYTVNARRVRNLLECILVSFNFYFINRVFHNSCLIRRIEQEKFTIDS